VTALVIFVVEVLQMTNDVVVNGGHDYYKHFSVLLPTGSPFLIFLLLQAGILLHIDIFSATFIMRGCYISINILLACIRRDSLVKLVMLHLYNFFLGEFSGDVFNETIFFATLV
jgi:hypothetical protein